MNETGWWVYALYSLQSQIIYVGMSENPDNRLHEHNTGKVKSTKGHVPWNLIYKEFVGERKDARAKEKYYKGASGKRKLRKLLE